MRYFLVNNSCDANVVFEVKEIYLPFVIQIHLANGY
jgi:hypothetical protein